MIQYNHEYTFSRGNGKITFTEGKNNTITASYKVFNDVGTITGKLNENVLEATFHSTSMNRVGLINFKFSADGFDAQWKNGLEPGTMRGKWFTEKDGEKANIFIFDITQIANWNFEEHIEEEVERLFQLQDEKSRDLFIASAVDFINQNHEFYWISYLIYYKAQDCYYESGNDDLEDFYGGFAISEKSYDFTPKDEFEATYFPERESDSHWLQPSDFKWSKDGGDKKLFIEVVLDLAKMSSTNYEDTLLNYAKLRNTAICCLWTSLQAYTMMRPTPDSEDLANCLWSVLADAAHDIEIFKADGNFGQEAVDYMLKYILRMDKEAFNAEENDELESFNDYVHDYIKISEEILDKDIFDM